MPSREEYNSREVQARNKEKLWDAGYGGNGRVGEDEFSIDGRSWAYRDPKNSRYFDKGAESRSRFTRKNENSYDMTDPLYNYSFGEVSRAGRDLGITNVKEQDDVDKIMGYLGEGYVHKRDAPPAEAEPEPEGDPVSEAPPAPTGTSLGEAVASGSISDALKGAINRDQQYWTDKTEGDNANRTFQGDAGDSKVGDQNEYDQTRAFDYLKDYKFEVMQNDRDRIKRD